MMPNRIVIIPEFAAAHMMDQWISNMRNTIAPDYILIVSGLFTNGPENKGFADFEQFKEKYCSTAQSASAHDVIVGFDHAETIKICRKYDKQLYPDGRKLFVIPMVLSYPHDADADSCFLAAMARVLGVVNVGDYIFPLEPDAFIHEKSVPQIEEALQTLEPGEGLSCRWVDFIQNQYYTENVNLYHPKYRRFVYRYDNIINFVTSISGFTSQNYPNLYKIDRFIVYHYCWFVSGKYRDMRFSLIRRGEEQYWKDFASCMDTLNDRAINYINMRKAQIADGALVYRSGDKALIRPSRDTQLPDSSAYVVFEDISHPKEIQSHPNWLNIEL